MNNTEKWMKDITPESLDLRQMDVMFVKSVQDRCNDETYKKRRREKIEKYKKQYGDDWAMHMLLDSKPDYDVDLKCINECIYNGEMPHLTGTPGAYFEFRNKLFSRLEHIYGADYREKLHHPVGDDETVELLLSDALKTGMWKELPDCLHEEYHKRCQNGEDIQV